MLDKPEPPDRFPQTRWSLVLHAVDGAAAGVALSELCQLYWMPLYAFIRRSGLGREDAEDATQEFLVRVIERRQFDRADPEKGRLRSFLLTDLKFFLGDRRKATQAQKRGGGAAIVELDAERAEGRYLELAGDGPAPDALFDRSWALSLLEAVLDALREVYQAQGRGELFAALQPMLQAGASENLAEIARRLEMSEGAVKVAAYRLRKRYQAELCRQIAGTIDDGENVESEMRYLFKALAMEE